MSYDSQWIWWLLLPLFAFLIVSKFNVSSMCVPTSSPPPPSTYANIKVPLSGLQSAHSPPFPIFESHPPPLPDSSTSQLEVADPDFYKIGFVRSMRAYGIEFKEGPDGFSVYASKDVQSLRRPRVIMEILLELMITISKKLPWMFFTDIVPIGHPIFDIINSTKPEVRPRAALIITFRNERITTEIWTSLPVIPSFMWKISTRCS